MKSESSTYNFPHLMIGRFFRKLVSGSLLVNSCFSTPHIILMLALQVLLALEHGLWHFTLMARHQGCLNTVQQSFYNFIPTP